jgi:hypothetical protein
MRVAGSRRNFARAAAPDRSSPISNRHSTNDPSALATALADSGGPTHA